MNRMTNRMMAMAMMVALLPGVSGDGEGETDLPNPPNGVCYIVGDNTIEGEPTFSNTEPGIVEFRLFEICGELHPGTAVGQVVQRDEFKTLVMTEEQARLILRVAEDWLENGLEPSRTTGEGEDPGG